MLHLELTIYRRINKEHTPKNDNFNQKKTIKADFKAVILSL